MHATCSVLSQMSNGGAPSSDEECWCPLLQTFMFTDAEDMVSE
jgi:hypothetical protein